MYLATFKQLKDVFNVFEFTELIPKLENIF